MGSLKKRATINDVARQAGLSLSTVSLVINNSGYASEKTRKKVLKIAEELSYHPSRAAKGLASKKSGNIGFIVSDDHFSRLEPFYTRIFLGTEFEARLHNYYILLTTVGNQFKEPDSVPRFLLERNVEGVIIAGKCPAKLVDYIDGLDIPIVLVDYTYPRKRFSSVMIDNRNGAHAAVEHLIETGHKEIGFIGGDITHPSIAERFLGYKETLVEHGIAPDNSLQITDEEDTTMRNGANAMRRMFDGEKKPTAIFAANDAMALGCIQFARQRSINIPDDLSLIGFDDIEASGHMEPPLTTVKVFKEEMGALAVQRLVDVFKTKSLSIVNTFVPVELIVRSSTRRTISGGSVEPRKRVSSVAL